MLETIQLSHIPPQLPLYVTLYRSLQNASFLRQQLLAGNADFEYAFIDASMIVSRNHVLAACFRVLIDYMNGRLKSRNVHSEIVFALSGNNNIGEAFRKFGIQETTTNLLVIRIPVPSVTTTGAPISSPPTSSNPGITTPPTITKETVQTHLDSSIQGTPVPFTDDNLSSVCDVAKVRKTYKIPAPSTEPTIAAEGEKRERWEREKQWLERAILGAIALRGAT